MIMNSTRYVVLYGWKRRQLKLIGGGLMRKKNEIGRKDIAKVVLRKKGGREKNNKMSLQAKYKGNKEGLWMEE
jgi:hypothetical protein